MGDRELVGGPRRGDWLVWGLVGELGRLFIGLNGGGGGELFLSGSMHNPWLVGVVKSTGGILFCGEHWESTDCKSMGGILLFCGEHWESTDCTIASEGCWLDWSSWERQDCGFELVCWVILFCEEGWEVGWEMGSVVNSKACNCCAGISLLEWQDFWIGMGSNFCFLLGGDSTETGLEGSSLV